MLQTLLSAVSTSRNKQKVRAGVESFSLLHLNFPVLEVELMICPCSCFNLVFKLRCSVIVYSLWGWLHHVKWFRTLYSFHWEHQVFRYAAKWLQLCKEWRMLHLLSQVWFKKQLDTLIFSKQIFLEATDVFFSSTKVVNYVCCSFYSWRLQIKSVYI